jgi:hypothetical protein
MQNKKEILAGLFLALYKRYGFFSDFKIKFITDKYSGIYNTLKSRNGNSRYFIIDMEDFEYVHGTEIITNKWAEVFVFGYDKNNITLDLNNRSRMTFAEMQKIWSIYAK